MFKTQAKNPFNSRRSSSIVGNDFHSPFQNMHFRSSIQPSKRAFHILSREEHYGQVLDQCIKNSRRKGAQFLLTLGVDLRPGRNGHFTAIREGGSHQEVISELLIPAALRNDSSGGMKDYLKGIRGEFFTSPNLLGGWMVNNNLLIRIDPARGKDNTEIIYSAVEYASRLAKEKGLNFRLTDYYSNDFLTKLGLLSYAERPPSRKRELKRSITQSTQEIKISEDFSVRLYYNFAKGTRFIDLKSLVKIKNYFLSGKPEEAELAIKALKEIASRMKINAKGNGYDVDLLLVDKNGNPINYQNERLKNLRDKFLEIVEGKLDISDSSAILLAGAVFADFMDSYTNELPEVFRTADKGSYAWIKAMYKALNGSNFSYFEISAEVDILASFVSGEIGYESFKYISPPNLTNGYSQIISDSKDFIQIASGKNQERVSYYPTTDTNQGNIDLTHNMLNAIEEKKGKLSSDNSLPCSVYLAKLGTSIGPIHNLGPRDLLKNKPQERYATTLCYEELESYEVRNRRTYLFESVNHSKSYVEISLNNLDEAKSGINTEIYKSDAGKLDYAELLTKLQNIFYKNLAERLKGIADISVLDYDVCYLHSKDPSNFFMREFIEGKSPKDKDFIESLDKNGVKELLTKSLVSSLLHIISMKTRGVEDDYVLDKEGKMHLVNTSTGFDPDNIFLDLKSLLDFVGEQAILVPYILRVRENAGEDKSAIKEYRDLIEKVFRQVTETLRDSLIQDSVLDIEKHSEFDENNEVAKFFLGRLDEVTRLFVKEKNQITEDFLGKIKHISNFFNRNTTNKESPELNHDLLRRLASIFSLVTFEKSPFTQSEVIDKVERLINDEKLTKKYTDDELAKYQVNVLDLSYITLDIKILEEALRKMSGIKSRLIEIPKIDDLRNMAINIDSSEEFLSCLKSKYPDLPIKREKLIRYYKAIHELMESKLKRSNGEWALFFKEIENEFKVDNSFLSKAKDWLKEKYSWFKQILS